MEKKNEILDKYLKGTQIDKPSGFIRGYNGIYQNIEKAMEEYADYKVSETLEPKEVCLGCHYKNYCLLIPKVKNNDCNEYIPM